jgi:hypothetical protein
MNEERDNKPAYLGRDKRGAIVFVSALSADGSLDKDALRTMNRLTKMGGTVVLTTVRGVQEALDRDGWGKPPAAMQMALFDTKPLALPTLDQQIEDVIAFGTRLDAMDAKGNDDGN